MAIEWGSSTFAALHTGQSASFGKKTLRPFATGNLNFVFIFCLARVMRFTDARECVL
jgi:hypothetical protein